MHRPTGATLALAVATLSLVGVSPAVATTSAVDPSVTVPADRGGSAEPPRYEVAAIITGGTGVGTVGRRINEDGDIAG